MAHPYDLGGYGYPKDTLVLGCWSNSSIALLELYMHVFTVKSVLKYKVYCIILDTLSELETLMA
jgi:hypothetical protein